MNKINKIFLIVLLLIPLFGFSQTNIRISIENQEDSVYYFCKYRGAKTIIIDTLNLKKGIIQYKSKTKLPDGIYLLTNSKNLPLTEILITEKQRFKLIINNIEDYNSFKVKGCAKETKLYYKLMAKVMQTEANIAALESEGGFNLENIKKIDSLNKDLASFEESWKINKKDAFINTVISSLKRHGMDDYWVDFPLYDARVLTYPLIDNKLNSYFDNLYADADRIIAEMDTLIAKTGDCVEVRDYLLWFFYRKYYNPVYMNLDDVYIHLVDEYFLKLELENVSESVINVMADRARNLSHLKIGAKIPNIGNLYTIESPYTALIFYDKTCKKCAQEGRILEDIRTRHPEMVIFPVEIHSTDMKHLLEIYDIQTTPLIYILDKHKKIIAKRINAEKVEQVLNMD